MAGRTGGGGTAPPLGPGAVLRGGGAADAAAFAGGEPAAGAALSCAPERRRSAPAVWRLGGYCGEAGDWLREDLYLAGGTGGDALAAAVYNKSPQENPGAAPAFVRAALVPVWRDGRGAGDGEPVGDWPAGVADGEYRMGGVTFTLAAGWDVPDGDGRY